MVSKDSVEKQLKRIKFNYHAWGKGEAMELPNILIEGEEIFDCVNGVYDGGFALLVATNVRLLLVDKKPLNYLTVEDMRFDMINEIDYSHRLFGAHISISAGSKNLKFMSYNQQRLRKCINHVQHCMAEVKKKQNDHQQDQNLHLEQINQQLQAYLLAQHQSRQKLEEQLRASKNFKDADGEQPKPSPELSDYLYAQSLLQQYQNEGGKISERSEAKDKPQPSEPYHDDSQAEADNENSSAALPKYPVPPLITEQGSAQASQMADLYAEGVREIFGRQSSDEQQSQHQADTPKQIPAATPRASDDAATESTKSLFDINPLRIAYSKLPMALRNKKFGRPSFHAHSQAETRDNATRQTQPAT